MSVTLEPGEAWTADDQCMVYVPGFFPWDWVPLNEGQTYRNNSKRRVELDVTYGTCRMCGEDHGPGPNKEPCLNCTCWTTNGNVGCPKHGAAE